MPAVRAVASLGSPKGIPSLCWVGVSHCGSEIGDAGSGRGQLPATADGHAGTRTDKSKVLGQLARAFQREGIDFALIGAFAMAARGVARATADLDVLAAGERADDVARIMLGFGYRELHRSPDAANYAAHDAQLGRVDFLFARRPYSRAMLERATARPLTKRLQVKVVEVEDIIGLKVQSSSNNPKRLWLDLADIERLLDVHRTIDMERVREYFRIFGRKAELDELLGRIKR